MSYVEEIKIQIELASKLEAVTTPKHLTINLNSGLTPEDIGAVVTKLLEREVRE